jgi:hypothetical protein
MLRSKSELMLPPTPNPSPPRAEPVPGPREAPIRVRARGGEQAESAAPLRLSRRPPTRIVRDWGTHA